MTSLNKKGQSGFTIVELLIVIVIIGILSALVITQILGATQQARDTERKTDINSVNTQIENYFAQKGSYPAIADINTEAWRTGNKFNVSDGAKALSDPQNTSVTTLNAADMPTTASKDYRYKTTPADCTSPTDNDGNAIETANPCTGYELVALLENKTDSQKDASSTADAAYYIKRSANQ